MKKSLTAIIEESHQHKTIGNYYQFQSKIYDLTRWSFLFGRLKILKEISFGKNEEFSLAEIGCGTGFNLKTIAKKYSNARLTGVDVSKDMMDLTEKKMSAYSNSKTFFQQPYDLHSDILEPNTDIILFSYALTMINPQWSDLLTKAYDDLAKGGQILVVDFHYSAVPFFKNHMSNHHVRMDRHLLPELKNRFTEVKSSVNSAYGGLWEYFTFVGEKK